MIRKIILDLYIALCKYNESLIYTELQYGIKKPNKVFNFIFGVIEKYSFKFNFKKLYNWAWHKRWDYRYAWKRLIMNVKK